MDSVNKDSLQQSILQAVDTIVSRRVKDADYDKTIIGTINSLVGIKNKKAVYKINYGNGFFNATVLNDEDTYIKNTPVYVFIPQGNFSKEKIILGRASNINADLDLNITNAVLNNFSIIGKNNLKKIRNKTIGLRSYHDLKEEIEDPSTQKHRIQVIYDSENTLNNYVDIESISNLETYLNEGSAIMLRADFRTSLPIEQKQQATGKYGLIFELLFNNEKLDWGSTQGEILINICEKDIIKATTEFGNDKTLKDYIIKQNETETDTIEGIIEHLDDINFETFISNSDSKLKVKISEMNALYATFIKNSPEKNQEIIEETILAFFKLLQELCSKDNSEDVKKIYQDWINTDLNTDKIKKAYLQLDSDNMIGAPLYFKNWTTQHNIFKIDNLKYFKKINKILFFKTGFIQNANYDTQHEEDIFVKNIGFYVLKPLDNISGDYSLKVEAAETGTILETEGEKVTFKGSFYRKLNDLSQNLNLTYYWFKEDPSVMVGSDDFNKYGGAGWKLVSDKNQNSRYFTTNFETNTAQKNFYKCVTVFTESSESEIVIVAPFTVYNIRYGNNIELTSNQGTVFQFDLGTPTITCLINGEEKNKTKENKQLKFYWSIGLENEEIPCYDQFNWKDLSIEEIENYQFQDQYLNNVEFYKLIINENENIQHEKINPNEETGYLDTTVATQLMYPMINLASDEKISIKCIVAQIESNNSETILGSAELEFENRGGALIDGYHIEFENDNQIFQYDEYGNSPKLNKLDPLEILPIKAKLISPSGAEFAGSNVQVDWIFNLNNTMLIPKGNLTLNPSTGIADTIKNETLCYFDILDLYNPDAINNQIMCHINFNGKDYYRQTNLFFTKIGENGTNGTDITVRIIPTSNNSILDTQALTLYTFKDNEDKDENGNEKIKGFLNEKYKKDDNQSSTSIQLTEVENTGFQVNVYQKGKLLPSNKYQSYWNLAGNPSETRISKGKNFYLDKLEGTNAYYLVWDSTEDNPYQLQIIKNHIKFSDIITTKDDNGNEIETETNKKEFYGYYPLPIIYFKNKKDIATYADNRLAIDKNFYLKEVTYNADGRNPIYNHNQGLKLLNLPENCKLIFTAKGGWNEEENEPDFLLFYQNKEPSTTFTIENSNDFDMIYVLPNDSCSGSKTNNRIEVVIQDNEGNLYATVSAPIIFTLNTFGLASLNAWDGNSVTVDDEGGYILAPQIGAGEKDNNNRFTGIVMGKTETRTGSSEKEKQIGLFGYKDGLQSIFLDAETGDAIFGLPDVEERKDEEGNLKKFYKKSNREAEDNYQEGRIELRPGGTSIIGGWKIGRKSLYYTSDGALGDKNGADPNPFDYTLQKNGTIARDSENRYGKHHDKDIAHDQGGILLYGGEKPYISIKSKPLEDVSEDLDSLLVEGDSLELQLDPNTPTLFTIFRHNGQPRYKDEREDDKNLIYEKNSRTFLAGINNRGEFVANSIGNKNVTYNSIQDSVGENIASKFYFNSLNAFNDTENRPTHIGFQMTADNKILGRLFMSLSDLNKTIGTNEFPILHISGGNGFSNRLSGWGEYLRGLSLHGRTIGLYVPDENLTDISSLKSKRETNSNFLLNQNFGQIQILEKDKFLLSRNEDSKLETTQNFNLYVGEEEDQAYSKTIYRINTGTEDNPTYEEIIINPFNTAYQIIKDDGTVIKLYVYQIDENSLLNQEYIQQNESYIAITEKSYLYIDEEDNNKKYYITLTNYNNNYYKYYVNNNLENYIKESDFLNNLYEYNEETNSYNPVQTEEDITDLNNGYFIVIKPDASEFNTIVEQNSWFINENNININKIYNDYNRKDDNNEYFKYDDNNSIKYLPNSTVFELKKVKNKEIYFSLKSDNAYYAYEYEENSGYIPISNMNKRYSQSPIGSYRLKNYVLNSDDYYVIDDDETPELNGIYSTANLDPDSPPLYPFEEGQHIDTLDMSKTPPIPLFEGCFTNYTVELNEEYIEDSSGEYILYNESFININDITTTIIYYLYNNEYYPENSFEEDNFCFYDNSYYNQKYIKTDENDNFIEYVLVEDPEDEGKTKYISLIDYNEKRYYQLLNNLNNFLDKIYLNQINTMDKYIYFNNNYILSNEAISDYYYHTTLSAANFLFNFYNINTIEKRNLSNEKQLYVKLNEAEPFLYILKEKIKTDQEYFNEQILNEDTSFIHIQDKDANWYYISIKNWKEKQSGVILDSGNFYLVEEQEANEEIKSSNKKFKMTARQAETEIGSVIGQTLYSLKTLIFDTTEANKVPKISIENNNLPVSIKAINSNFNFSFYRSNSNSDKDKPIGQIIFNDKNIKKDQENILGAFVSTTINNSENLLKNGLIITSRNGHLEHSNQLKLIAYKIGSEQEYAEINPQILLQAGNTTKNSKSFSTKLILNSSDTGWRVDDTNIDKGWKNKDRPWSSYPLFKVQGKTAFLGLFVQNSSITTEVFYVSPPTIINNTLEIPEAARLTFSEKDYKNSNTSSSTLAAALDALWAKINNLQGQLTTLINNASSYATKSDLGNYYTKRETERDFAPKNHTHNYASATHTHPINYFLGSSPKCVTSVGQRVFNVTGQTGVPSGKSSGYNK